MLIINEHCQSYYPHSRRKKPHHPLGAWKALPFATDSTCPNHSIDSRRCFQSRHCQALRRFQTYRATVARPFFSAAFVRLGERCPSARTNSPHQLSKGLCNYQYDTSTNSLQCYPLECTLNGQRTWRQQSDHLAYLETAQSKTSFGQNFQAQPRQTIYRKIVRCGWPLLESSGQGTGPMCRRKEPNPSSRSNPTGFTDETRSMRDHDARLQTQRYNHFIRGFEHARWQSHRRLHATPPTSGIHPLFTINQHQNSRRSGFASDRRQLWNAQTPTGAILAKTSSAIPPAFYSNIKLLAEHGGTMVSRDHRQTHSSRLIQKCSGFNCRHPALHRNTQSKSARLCMERVSREDYG